MSEKEVEVLQKVVEAWNRRDLDSFLEPIHPEVEFHSEIIRRAEGGAGFVRGVGELRRFWEEWSAVWDLTIEISDYHDLGEVVVGVGHARIHGMGSGVDLESPVAYVNEFEDGSIRKIRAYLDPKQAFEAVGLPGDGASS